MNRTQARKLAETITNEEIKEMFDNAKNFITNWRAVSIVNKGMTKGVAWNVLAKDFTVSDYNHVLGKANMIREFGDFLPIHLQPIKKPKYKPSKPPVHQQPIFK